jgi:ferrous iron transport protein A
VSSPLASAPHGVPLTVVGTGAEREVVRRLAELGLRPGAHLRSVQRTAGGGRVVDVAGSRIALGRRLLTVIEVERAPAPGSPHAAPAGMP